MQYELLYIIPTKFAENEVQPIADKVSGIIEKNGGKIVKKENWGKKKFSYPIKTFRHGYYILNEIDFQPSDLKELNRELRLTPEILRYQITKKIAVIAPAKPRRKIEEKSQEMLSKKTMENIEKEAEVKEATDKKKVSMEDLDKKLDEILDM